MSRSILSAAAFTLLACICVSVAAEEFVGSSQCASCHADEHELWQGSHHDLAMQLATPDTVLGDFDNASFVYNGITSTFSKDGDAFIVTTDGEDGVLTKFTVEYVFGVYPLQQYLLPLSRGRLQALSITWDARPATEGGQRWYHLYPDESVDATDPLHWTGPYQNWNTRCAECHSTDLQKNYDATTRSFDTVFAEINVSCESCHGPGSKHIELAASDSLTAGSHGLQTDLLQRGEWAFPENETIAKRRQSLSSNSQIDNCARCHARRGTLGDYHYGADLLDTHRLSLPQSPLYHYDGQILDEVYVYGSFVQSKMHMAGVVCSNCHEPHSLELRAPGNGVCAQCHKPEKYDSVQHHHHPQTSSGAQCASCHMPETTYMGVDPRRDHSFRIPRPDLSVVMGTPNACNQCHVDQKPSWALEALRDWDVHFRDTASHPARAFLLADAGDTRVLPQLATIARDTGSPPIWRATAIEAIANNGGGARDTLQLASQFLYDDNTLIRTSTIRSIQGMPLSQRYQLLRPLIDDDVTAVRIEVATSLAGVPLDQISPEDATRLLALFKEYESIQRLHADMPGTQMQLGVFYFNRGDLPSSERAYREALTLNRQLVPAYLNLADLLRSADREPEARQQLLTALKIAPDNSATMHSLGLLETRGGNTELALDYLGRAAAQEEVGTRHRFVYAIALHDLGQPRAAVEQLQKLLRHYPENQEVLLALANYSDELGQRKQAIDYADSLLGLAPTNQTYQQLKQQLMGPTGASR
ncbi:MAG: Tfp pilus assembly protein PilF [Halieaceae bacterium]|jgi:Tfp pilus assembly protein PilF